MRMPDMPIDARPPADADSSLERSIRVPCECDKCGNKWTLHYPDNSATDERKQLDELRQRITQQKAALDFANEQNDRLRMRNQILEQNAADEREQLARELFGHTWSVCSDPRRSFIAADEWIAERDRQREAR